MCLGGQAIILSLDCSSILNVFAKIPRDVACGV